MPDLGPCTSQYPAPDRARGQGPDLPDHDMETVIKSMGAHVLDECARACSRPITIAKVETMSKTAPWPCPVTCFAPHKIWNTSARALTTRNEQIEIKRKAWRGKRARPGARMRYWPKR